MTTTLDSNAELEYTVTLLADLVTILAVLETRLRMNPDVVDRAEREIRRELMQLLDREMAVDVVEHAIEQLKADGNIDALATFAFVLIDRLRHVEKWT